MCATYPRERPKSPQAILGVRALGAPRAEPQNPSQLPIKPPDDALKEP